MHALMAAATGVRNSDLDLASMSALGRVSLQSIERDQRADPHNLIHQARSVLLWPTLERSKL